MASRSLPMPSDRDQQSVQPSQSVRRPRRRGFWAVVLAALLAMTTAIPMAVAGGPLGGLIDSTLPGQAPTTPEEIGDGSTADLLYADATEGLSQVDPPEANPSGTAELTYPLVLPKGRGSTPDVSLSYSSEGGSSWAGLGWDLAPPEIAVDTSFGSPRFCDGSTKSPPCANVESESYTLDGDALVPNAVKAVLEPRVAERQDFTRKVETEFEQVIRHGDKPSNYTWEVRDKKGGVRFYGMAPDAGGPVGASGTKVGIDDRKRQPGSILTDANGNGVRWFLTAQRDIGVNLIRYEYTTVSYQKDTAARTGWSPLAAGTSCPSGEVCPKHVYLSKILYTAGSTASGAAEDPAYEVRFNRTPGARTDAVLDGRGGVLDLDQDLLTSVDVVYRKTGDVVTRYALTYAPDPHFGKTRLTTVEQIGCNGLTACPATGLKHTFSYFDDIATAKSGFDKEARWQTGDGPLPQDGTTAYVDSKLSGLGASMTQAGDGKIYVGFNLADPEKTGSVGGSFAMNGTTTDSVIEFIDLNGDSLPDKVYRDVIKPTGPKGTIEYQLNTSLPTASRTADLTFGPTHTLQGVSGLPVQRSIGIQGGPEAYFGVFAVFNVGGQWSWSDSYFTDANGDGLVDFVDGTKVLFNHLVCDPTKAGVEACVPTFDSSDTLTRVPLTPQTVPTSDAAFDAMVDRLREAVPPVDTVRRWVAPFTGDVTVTAKATLSTPLPDAAGGAARVAIQKGGGEVDHSTLTVAAPMWQPALDPIHVDKGQALYFRAGSRPKGNGDVVTWTADITYAGGAAPDANGLDQRAYSLTDDFTLAGRPGLFTSVNISGTAQFTAAINKTAATSDNLRPEVMVRNGTTENLTPAAVTITPLDSAGNADAARAKVVTQSGGQWCVADASTSFGCYATAALANARLTVVGASEVGRFGFTAAPTFSPPVKNAKDEIIAYDAVLTRLAVDSPVDLSTINWFRAGKLCFLSSGSCDPTKPILAPHMDVDTYPNTTRSAPATAWTSTLGRTVTPRLTGARDSDNPGGEMIVTAKTAAGVVYKASYAVPSGGGSFDSGSAASSATTKLPDITLDAGTPYWFDVTMRRAGLSSHVSGVNLVMSWTESSVAKSEDVPQTVNWAGAQSYFPIAYRGWAAAGYTATGVRATTKLTESDFEVPDAGGAPFDNKDDACQSMFGGACPTDASINTTGFGSYPDPSNTLPEIDTSKATEKVPNAFAFNAVVDPNTLAQSWDGPKSKVAKIYAAQGGVTGAARFGEDLPITGAPASGGTQAPKLLGVTGPIFMLMAGVGPFGGSFAAGWSRSMVDFLDLNGDGFPDTVRPDSVTYTNPRGTQECGPANARVACTGGGVSVVDSATTLAISGSFGGAPIGISGNNKGTTNATRGGSSGKGGPAADTFNANIGASLGLGSSFTNPSGSNKPSNTTALAKVPGDGTIPVQETLSDINGDGLPDRIKVNASGIRVRLNLGHSFTAEMPWTVGSFSSTNSFSGSVGGSFGFNIDYGGLSGGIAKNSNVDLPNVSWDDVNGDGLVDAVYRSKDDDNNDVVKIAFSNGTGLTTDTIYGKHQSSGYKVLGIIDVDGVPQIRQDSAESLGGGADVTVGIPLCLVGCYLILNPGGHYENSMTSTDVDLTDVNGDGYADTVSRASGSSQVKVALNTQGRTNLLKSVTTPMGGTIGLDYHRDGNTTSHPDSQWLLDDVTIDSTRGADGIAQKRSTISYGRTAQDFVNRTDLGYDMVTVSEHYTAYDHAVVDSPTTTDKVRTVQHKYLNGSVFESGLEYETTVFDGPAATGTPMQATRTTWVLKDLDKNASAGGGYGPLDLGGATVEQRLALRATPQVSKVEQLWYASGSLEQTVTTEYGYDRLGNPTTVVDRGLPGTTADDTVASISYANCETSLSATLTALFGCGATLKAPPATRAPYWSATNCPTWDSQPVGITVTAPGGPALRSKKGNTAYCDNNAVTVQRELLTPGVGGALDTYAETLLSFDAYGSYNRVVMPQDADGKRYAVRYLYDDVNHANVASVTDFETVGSGDPSGVSPADTTRKLISEDQDPAGQAVGLTSTAAFDGPTGRVKTRTDANGNITTYTYDALSRVRTITSPDGGVATFAYHPDDKDYPYATVTHTDEFNPGTTIDTATYVDGSGRVTGRKRDALVYDPVTGDTGAGYACEGGSDVDGLGRTIHQWKPFLQTGKTLADYTVDVSNPTYVKATITTFDVLDRVRVERLSNEATTRTAYGFEGYDPFGTVATVDVTDPLGRHTKTWQDAHENVLRSEDRTATGSSLFTTYAYDRLGQILRIDSPGGLVTTHTYDLLGRRTSTTTPDGGLVNWTYDLAGNKTSEQSPVLREEDNVRTVFGFDFGLLTSITYPDEKPVTMDYGGYLGHPTTGNAAGKMVHVEDKARIQTFGYDVNGRLAQDVTTMTGPHPNKGPFTTSYDNDWLGRLATVSLPDGETVRNDYDTGGRLKRVVGTNDCTELGLLTTSVDATATTITVTEYQHGDPASSWNPTLPFTIRLDGEQLNVTARTPGTVPGTFDYTVERGVNGTVLVPTAAPHSSGATVKVDVAVPCVHSYLDNQRYDVYGTTSQRRTGDGVVDTTYRDVDTRALKGRSALSPDGTRLLMNLKYDYDLVGNVKQFRNELPPDVPSLFGGPTTQTYTYDGRYRLREATGTWDYAPKTTRSYTWSATLDDATSKVTRMAQRDWTVDTGCTRKCKEATVLANTFDRTAYTYDAAKPNQATQVVDSLNKRTETYEYDSDGEQTTVTNPDMIRNVSWDWAGKLVEIVDHNPNNTGRKQTDYVYDYAGQLSIEIKEQGVTYYVNPWVTVRNGTMLKNIWAGNDRLAVNMTTTGDSFDQRVYFMHKDLQGSTNIVTDRVGKVFQHQEYFPTGQVWIKEDSTIFRTPWQYAGGYVDEDHRIINFGDRWYSTDQARFLTVDPILTDDATALVDNPTLTTAYTYGQPNPVGFVDTDGRVSKPINLNEAINTIAELKPEGDPIKTAQLTKLANFFAANTDTVRGRATLSLLKGFNSARERKAKYFSRLDVRPVLEFQLKDGKLDKVKLGFGVGKRLKVFDAEQDAGATPQAADSVAANQPGSSGGSTGADANGPGGQGKSTTSTTSSPSSDSSAVSSSDSSSASSSGQPQSQGASKPATSANAQAENSESGG